MSSTHSAVPYFARNTANSRPLPILDFLQPETCEGLNNHTPALLDIWLCHITSLASLHVHSLALDGNMPMDTPMPRRVSGQSHLPPEAYQRLPFLVSSLLPSSMGGTMKNGDTPSRELMLAEMMRMFLVKFGLETPSPPHGSFDMSATGFLPMMRNQDVAF